MIIFNFSKIILTYGAPLCYTKISRYMVMWKIISNAYPGLTRGKKFKFFRFPCLKSPQQTTKKLASMDNQKTFFFFFFFLAMRKLNITQGKFVQGVFCISESLCFRGILILVEKSLLSEFFLQKLGNPCLTLPEFCLDEVMNTNEP